MSIGVHLHQDSAVALAEMIRNGTLDLAFLRDPAPLSVDLVSLDFAVARIAAAVPRHHPLADAEQIGLGDLRDEDFVLPDPTALPTLAHQVQLACRESGFTPRTRAVSDDLTGLFSYVASGLCVSLLPERLRDFHVAEVAFVPFAGRSPYLETTLVAIRPPDADAAVLRLLELITRRMAG